MQRGFLLSRDRAHRGSSSAEDSKCVETPKTDSSFNSDNVTFTFGPGPAAPAAPQVQPGFWQTFSSTVRESVASADVDVSILDVEMTTTDTVQEMSSQMPHVQMAPPRLRKDRTNAKSSVLDLSAAFRREHAESTCVDECCGEKLHERRTVSIPASSSNDRHGLEMMPSPGVAAEDVPSQTLQALREEIQIRERLRVLAQGPQNSSHQSMDVDDEDAEERRELQNRLAEMGLVSDGEKDAERVLQLVTRMRMLDLKERMKAAS
eukprot:2687728-Karenia_brevis.AAC.1